MGQDKQQKILRDVLKAHSLRYSKPREVILSFFRERDTHVSAENLYVTLKERGENLSLSTVYLNLNVLRGAGLVREFSGANGEALYDSNIAPHYHLICKRCGAILDLPPLLIDETSPVQALKHHAEAETGWLVDNPSLNLMGTCPTCLLQTSVQDG